jgi:hypothetical protein
MVESGQPIANAIRRRDYAQAQIASLKDDGFIDVVSTNS